jgi:hypothetical protein
MCLHLVHVPLQPNAGLDDLGQHRAGRARLLEMSFADFEARICDEFDRMLGPGGFSSARDIATITVNRWSHGHAHAANSLYEDDADATIAAARKRFGNVAIANSDAAWTPMRIRPSTRPGGRCGSLSGEGACGDADLTEHEMGLSRRQWLAYPLSR